MSSGRILAVAILAAMAAVAASDVHAQTLTTLYTFMDGADGTLPQSGVIYQAGTLYGTATYGGVFDGTCNLGTDDNGCGVLFAVNATASGESVVHTFQGGADGAFPAGAPVYQSGKLYGATLAGGTGCGGGGCGTVYAINASTGVNTVLHAFNGTTEGGSPSGVIYQGGMLYGTNNSGGSAGAGTVFAINATTGAETTLYNFLGGTDPQYPYSTLTYQGGFLYGTSNAGGTSLGTNCSVGCGTVFAINATTGAETVLYRFTSGTDGAHPVSGVIYVSGTLYGATGVGGNTKCVKFGCGTLYSINPTTGAETVLYRFKGGTKGQDPGALTYEKGSLYGELGNNSANYDGLFSFKISKARLGVLYDFSGSVFPQGGLAYDGGTFYGTTAGASALAHGTLFSFLP